MYHFLEGAGYMELHGVTCVLHVYIVGMFQWFKLPEIYLVGSPNMNVQRGSPLSPSFMEVSWIVHKPQNMRKFDRSKHILYTVHGPPCDTNSSRESRLKFWGSTSNGLPARMPCHNALPACSYVQSLDNHKIIGWQNSMAYPQFSLVARASSVALWVRM